MMAGLVSTITRFLFVLPALLPALLAPAPAAAQEQPRPNFVFVLVDDLGWRDVGAYGSDFYETPNIDRLAREGMRFLNGYAAAPVCSPTRASILTGRYPARLRQTDWIAGRGDRPDQRLAQVQDLNHLPLEETTLAEALGASGYATAHIGKWHLGGNGFLPEDQGFSINIGGDHNGSPSSYFWPYKDERRPGHAIEALAPGGRPGEYLTDRLGEEAARFIAVSRARPFFLYLPFYNVHTPLQGKPELVAKYEAKAAALGIPDSATFGMESGHRLRVVQNHAVYAAMVEAMDAAVGRVLRALEENGVAENTVVVFFSDNGGLATAEGWPTTNLPLRAGKGWLYEGGIREPLIVRWPGRVAAGSVQAEPVSSIDFFPTFLEIAGVTATPAGPVDGVSFLPALLGNPFSRGALYWHYPHYSNQGGRPGGAVLQDGYKLIEFFEDAHVELYALRDDPGETRDLAGVMPERAAALRARLHAWRDAVDAQMPAPNPDYVARP